MFQSHFHIIFCYLVTIISKYLHSSHFASLVVFKLTRKSQFKSKFASSFSCKIPDISLHSFLSVYYFLALLQVVYMSIIKIFRFYRQTVKSDSTLCGKLARKIFQVFTFYRSFYESALRVDYDGMLALFFRYSSKSRF